MTRRGSGVRVPHRPLSDVSRHPGQPEPRDYLVNGVSRPWLEHATGTGDDPDTQDADDPSDGGVHLLDLVAAVEEALGRWVLEQETARHGAPDPETEGIPAGDDPLKEALARLLRSSPSRMHRPQPKPSNRPPAAGPPPWPNTTTPATTGPTPQAAGASHRRYRPYRDVNR
jgi:hypothetical protein